MTAAHPPAAASTSAPASPWRARLDLVLAAALFSTGGAFIKWCDLSALQVAGWRSLVAGTFLLLAWPAARRGFTVGSLLFGMLYATTMISFVSANKFTTSASAIFLQSTAPLFVLLMSPLVLKERVRRSDLLFMAALAGGLALCFGDSVAAGGGDGGAQRTAPRPLLGNAIAVLSGLAWAATIVGLRWFGKRARPGQDGAASSVVVGNFTCFVAAALLATAMGERFVPGPELLDFARPEAWRTLGSLAFLGVLQLGLAYCVLSRGLKSVPAVEASLLLLVEPVFNPIWAWLVHDEVPGRWTVAGGGVIMVATLFHALANAGSAAARAERAVVGPEAST